MRKGLVVIIEIVLPRAVQAILGFPRRVLPDLAALIEGCATVNRLARTDSLSAIPVQPLSRSM